MRNIMAILKLSQDGLPEAWLTAQQAATVIAKDLVIWSLGSNCITLRGGSNRDGVLSTLNIPAIIATKGQMRESRFTPAISNRLLFRRDGYQCMYCGVELSRAINELSRDHIKPRGQGGLDIWTNITTSCKRCNSRKGCRTPEQAGMELIAVPFTPNRFEFMYLAGRKMRSEQVDYLSQKFNHQKLKEVA